MHVALASVLGVLLGEGPTAVPHPPLPGGGPREIASYSIDARLDPATHRLDGTQELRFVNTSAVAVSEVRLHVYWNAWRNTQSSFLRRAGARSDRRPEDYAYVDVVQATATVAGLRETDVLASLEWIAPDDGNTSDRTVLRVPLPAPLAPGDTLQLEVAWESRVPRTFARTGRRGDYYFLAQWFPKIGVLRPDGSWECHQFVQTEFFADFGSYDVRLTVPAGWVVGATGREVAVAEHGDGTSTHHYHQDGVHDFAWTTSPEFRVRTATFEHDSLPRTDLRLLLMPDHVGLEERYFAAARAALEDYGTWFGPYPYGHITVVDPAYGSDTGGMEYPTLVTGGTRWLSPPSTRSPESVTVHEVGHQFWYGMVANDEFSHAWLDEGFNTWSQGHVLAVRGPQAHRVLRVLEGIVPWVFDDLPLAERSTGADRFAGPRGELVLDPLKRPSWDGSAAAYRVNAYDKPALILRTLEGWLGWETMQRVMAAHFQRARWRHPTPEDFFAIVAEISGQDLRWYFDQVFGGTPTFDYGVEGVQCRPTAGHTGFGVGPHADGEVVAPGDERACTVTVRRYGDGVFPVDVRTTLGDGTVHAETWDGAARWTSWTYAGTSPVVRVEVDPEHRLALDVSSTNDSWVQDPPVEFASSKWAALWLLEVQHLLESFAGAA